MGKEEDKINSPKNFHMWAISKNKNKSSFSNVLENILSCL